MALMLYAMHGVHKAVPVMHTWIRCQTISHISHQQLQDFVLIGLADYNIILKVDLRTCSFSV